MKIYKILFFNLILLGSALCAVSAPVEETYQEGKITIRNTTSQDENVFRLKVGEKVEFDLPIYSSEFFGLDVVLANARMTNNVNEPVKAVYFVSFYNDDNELVGCHQGSWDLGVDASIPYGSGIIYMNADTIKTVSFYRLRTLAFRK